MGANYITTSSLPATQEWGWLRRNAARLILGRPGKFSNFSFRNYLAINQKTTIIPTDDLMQVAMEHGVLNYVISRGAELFSLCNTRHVDKDGNDIKDSPLLKKLENPNPLQTRTEFLYEFYVLNAVFSKTFQHVIKGLAYQKEPDAIWLLPSGQVKIKATGKTYRQTKIEDIIEAYEVMGDETPFDVQNIIYMREGIGVSLLDPISRIEALKIPLSNIQAALKSFNIIATERGQIGYLSSENNADAYGKLPMDEKESTRLKEKYQEDAGLDSEKGHVTFTHSNVKWVPLTFDVEQLQLFPGMESAFGQVCDAYGHRRDLYSSTKGATYENQKEAKKQTIEDGIQPLADRVHAQWTYRFCDPVKGDKLIACYDQLPCMKADERLESQGDLYKAQAMDILLKNGTVSHETVAEECEVEMTGDKVIQVNAPPTSNANNQNENK